MKVLQVNPTELKILGKEYPNEYLVVESQVYGQDSDLFMHIVCRDEIAKIFTEKFFLREVADKGRTPGLWQNLGGAGLFRVDAIPPGAFRPELVAVLQKNGTERPLFDGETWNEILRNVPISIDKKVKLGVYEHSF